MKKIIKPPALLSLLTALSFLALITPFQNANASANDHNLEPDAHSSRLTGSKRSHSHILPEKIQVHSYSPPLKRRRLTKKALMIRSEAVKKIIIGLYAQDDGSFKQSIPICLIMNVINAEKIIISQRQVSGIIRDLRDQVILPKLTNMKKTKYVQASNIILDIFKSNGGVTMKRNKIIDKLRNSEFTERCITRALRSLVIREKLVKQPIAGNYALEPSLRQRTYARARARARTYARANARANARARALTYARARARAAALPRVVLPPLFTVYLPSIPQILPNARDFDSRTGYYLNLAPMWGTEWLRKPHDDGV